jgi:hypothetical protein
MTLGSHQQAIGKSQAHLTPQWIVRELGTFDLDPAAASPRPWDCATTNYVETQWFKICWQKATSILFMSKRVIFMKGDGTPCTTNNASVANSGAPPCFISFGEYDSNRLRKFADQFGGAFVTQWDFY